MTKPTFAELQQLDTEISPHSTSRRTHPRRPPFPLPPPHKIIKRLHPIFIRAAKHAPFGLQRRAIERLMLQVFEPAFAAGQLDFMKGYWLQLHVKDAGIQWNITLGKHGLILVGSEIEPNVCISGNLKDFVALANQEEDPDTLFFQRRLMIEGDTDLGLGVKNLMFSTEISGLPKLISQALQRYISLVESAV